MRGKHEVVVANRRLRYKFAVQRNITVLKGDSATGKTTLIDMVGEYQARGADSGITVRCDKPCIVLAGVSWRLILENTHDSIVFIDEGDTFVRSVEFAEAIRGSDNYYVIATRAGLPNLPYSVNEVYGIRNKSGNRYQGTKRLYSEFYPLYQDAVPGAAKPDCVIVEDSNAGFEFFSNVCGGFGIDCISAEGNAKVEAAVYDCEAKSILVIVDGAAFGPHIEKLLNLSQIKNISIYLPESFEWVILSSGVLRSVRVDRILESPAEHIKSSEYFSWERFFTALLVDESQGTYLAYNKRTLNSAYLEERAKAAILDVMPVLKDEERENR